MKRKKKCADAKNKGKCQLCIEVNNRVVVDQSQKVEHRMEKWNENRRRKVKLRKNHQRHNDEVLQCMHNYIYYYCTECRMIWVFNLELECLCSLQSVQFYRCSVFVPFNFFFFCINFIFISLFCFYSYSIWTCLCQCDVLCGYWL